MRTRLIAGTASAVLIVAGVLVGIWVWMKPLADEPPVAETIVVESARPPVYFPQNPPDGKLFEIETVGLVFTLTLKGDCLLFEKPGNLDYLSYLVVWPPDYRLHFGPDGVEVQGNTFTARPGDTLVDGRAFTCERSGHPVRRPG